MPSLVLFDIDMTLIRTQRAGRAAIEKAALRLFAIENAVEAVRIDGRTDHAIFMDLIALHRLSESEDPLVLYRKLADAYLEDLAPTIAERGGEVLPGVPSLLEALAQSHGAVGLATGNMQRGAAIKLGHFGLWESFAAGGFGDDTPVRAEVVREGIENLAAHLGITAHAADCVVIGDTPLDVEAAHLAGAKAMAVATGAYDLVALETSGAEWVLPDLADVDRVLAILRS